MITIYHSENRIVKVISDRNGTLLFNEKDTIAEGLIQLALQFPKSKMVWCKEEFKEFLNIEGIQDFFHHDKMMFSHHPGELNYLVGQIGYVDESPFIKVNKKVSYPTWQMSSFVGAIHASLLIEIKDKIKRGLDFDYYLNSVAKLCMPYGLLCYSEPRLLKKKQVGAPIKQDNYTLFRFVKQHYKTRWVFLLLFNLIVYERKLPVLPFVFSFFYKNRSRTTIDLDGIKVQSSKNGIDMATIDVIIPTIGRKEYLYNVLLDLKAQIHLPTNVIIVEQNPDEGSKSELGYLTSEEWPFLIKHTFTHQAGACNARNLALEQITSEWVFFADDDIRINTDFIRETLEQINNFSAKAVTLRCFQKGEKQTLTGIFQWGTFGSGCSLVWAYSLQRCKFGMGYEFGFGEDGDFGMQLRNQGCDILYLPEPSILHLKAPIGGFRTKPVLQWQNDDVQPKPSPTIMLHQISHHTREQIRAYKTILFFKYYKHQTIKNPLRYYFHFQKQWSKSVFWANTLKMQNEV